MAFKLDFNNTFGNGKIEDGEYEVICTASCEDATPGGTVHVKMNLRIRNDIDQPHKNMVIFHKIWRNRDTQDYNFKNFNTIGAAMELQQGKTYETFEDLLKDFEGKLCRVKVANEVTENNGKEYENLNVKYFSKTKFPNCNHVFKSANVTTQTQISDNDLPF